MKRSKIQVGQWAEELACAYLCQQGLQLIERNYRCRLGEIDLVMLDLDFLAVVEVRYRSNERFGSSLESVDLRKQRKIVAVTDYYLQTHQAATQNYRCRFDIVAINGPQIPPRVQWIKDAFWGE